VQGRILRWRKKYLDNTLGGGGTLVRSSRGSAGRDLLGKPQRRFEMSKVKCFILGVAIICSMRTNATSFDNCLTVVPSTCCSDALVGKSILCGVQMCIPTVITDQNKLNLQKTLMGWRRSQIPMDPSVTCTYYGVYCVGAESFFCAWDLYPSSINCVSYGMPTVPSTCVN